MFKITLYFLLLTSCATRETSTERRTVNDIHLRLSMMPPSFERYQIDGPFEVEEKKDILLSISTEEQRDVDIYRTRASGNAPIVVISHGNFSGKKAHRDQARRLASWGFHVVILELPNRNEWIENGRKIYDLALFLRKWPKFLGDNVDAEKIILVGHSFGGSAVTLAASQGAPNIGLILLDPAVVHPSVAKAMEQVQTPGVLLGSDLRVFVARGRSLFKKKWGSEFAEISIKGATHDDAQGPSMFSSYTLGVDPFTDDIQRGLFKASIVSAAISIANSGNLEQFRRDLTAMQRTGAISPVQFRR